MDLLSLFENTGFVGIMGAVLATTVSGLASYCLQKKALNHQFNVDKYKLMVEVYKNAIEAAVDIMHATWKKDNTPSGSQAESVFLEAWAKTWKSSGYLRRK